MADSKLDRSSVQIVRGTAGHSLRLTDATVIRL
jgi:hypothetical protein